MILLTLTITFLAALVLGFISYDLQQQNHHLRESLETTEKKLILANRAYEEVQHELHALRNPEHLTAKDIAERSAKRLHLRKSPSDLMTEQEAAHRKNEERHLTIARNIELVGADVALRLKEKK